MFEIFFSQKIFWMKIKSFGVKMMRFWKGCVLLSHLRCSCTLSWLILAATLLFHVHCSGKASPITMNDDTTNVKFIKMGRAEEEAQ